MVLYSSIISILLCIIHIVAAILNGKEAKIGEYTYQVAIQYNGVAACGGALIGDAFVLTAAHCVIDNDGKFRKYQPIVVIGVADLDDPYQPGVRIPVQVMYAARGFTPELEKGDNLYRASSDIAVLKLERPIEIGKYRKLRKLNLPPFGDDYVGEMATVTGFGHNFFETERDPDTNDIEEYTFTDGKMHYATAKITSNEVCAEKKAMVIRDSEMCAKIVTSFFNRKRTGICTGDSGSPLVHKNDFVVGIVTSSPAGCDESREPSIYTRVTPFLDFINNAMADTRTLSMRVAIWHTDEDNCDASQPFLYEVPSDISFS